jgi:hypothetical protein
MLIRSKSNISQKGMIISKILSIMRNPVNPV